MRLALAYCYRGTVHHCFMDSTIKALLGDASQRQAIGQLTAIETLYLPEGRNACVKAFLKGDCDAMLSIDTDITYGLDQVYAIADMAESRRGTVLAGCYLDYTSHQGDMAPHWYLETEPPPMERMTPEDADRLFEHPPTAAPIKGCGMGFTLIPRMVVAGPGWNGQWFGGKGREVCDGGFTGEDIFFCRKAIDLGFQIAAVGIKVGHTKARVL